MWPWALHRHIFRALPGDLFFQMVILRLNAVDASPIRLVTSVAPFGTALPRNTNSSTLFYLSPLMTIRLSLGETVLHLVPFIFIPHFSHAFLSCVVDKRSFSKIADGRFDIVCVPDVY